MKGSLIIVGFFVLGALCGVYHLIPYDFTQSKLSFYALCALMFSVGVSVGNDPQTLRNFRSLLAYRQGRFLRRVSHKGRFH